MVPRATTSRSARSNTLLAELRDSRGPIAQHRDPASPTEQPCRQRVKSRAELDILVAIICEGARRRRTCRRPSLQKCCCGFRFRSDPWRRWRSMVSAGHWRRAEGRCAQASAPTALGQFLEAVDGKQEGPRATRRALSRSSSALVSRIPARKNAAGNQRIRRHADERTSDFHQKLEQCAADERPDGHPPQEAAEPDADGGAALPLIPEHAGDERQDRRRDGGAGDAQQRPGGNQPPCCSRMPPVVEAAAGRSCQEQQAGRGRRACPW